MPTQAFKGVVRALGPQEIETGEKLYRYVVVGVAVTNQPVPELEPDLARHIPSEAVLCGECPGLLEALAVTERGESSYRLGDATAVIAGLSHLRRPSGGQSPHDEG